MRTFCKFVILVLAAVALNIDPDPTSTTDCLLCLILGMLSLNTPKPPVIVNYGTGRGFDRERIYR